MYLTSPVVPGRQRQEFSWAHGMITGLPVNPEENTGTIVLRYKLSWRERLAVFLHGDLWAWIWTDNQIPQWPGLRVNPPVDIGAKVLPDAVELFQRKRENNARDGILVPNPQPDGTMNEKMEPNLERELRMTLPEKIEERRIMNTAFRVMDEQAQEKLEASSAEDQAKAKIADAAIRYKGHTL